MKENTFLRGTQLNIDGFQSFRKNSTFIFAKSQDTSQIRKKNSDRNHYYEDKKICLNAGVVNAPLGVFRMTIIRFYFAMLKSMAKKHDMNAFAGNTDLYIA